MVPSTPVRRSVVLALAALILSRTAWCDEFDLEKLMSRSDYRRTGVHKLKPAERKRLESWMVQYLGALLQELGPSSTQSSGASRTVQSSIQGSFSGYSHGAVFPLSNGQVWRQIDAEYDYNYDYAPDVTIFPSSEGWRMLVDGMDQAVLVEQLR